MEEDKSQNTPQEPQQEAQVEPKTTTEPADQPSSPPQVPEKKPKKGPSKQIIISIIVVFVLGLAAMIMLLLKDDEQPSTDPESAASTADSLVSDNPEDYEQTDLITASFEAAKNVPPNCQAYPPLDESIPTNAFYAYYLNSKDPSSVVHCEEVDRVALNYNDDEDDEFSINPDDFAGYWVGNLTFDETTTQTIALSQSWSQTKLIIDGEIVIEAEDSQTKEYTFSAGTHKVEVQFVNNWHTVGLTLQIGSTLQPKTIGEAAEHLAEVVGGGSFSSYYVDLYESGASDRSVLLESSSLYKSGASVLILSSYEPIVWDLSGLNNKPKVVIVASYEPGADVINAGSAETYLVPHLEGLGTLYPECEGQDGYFYCEDDQDGSGVDGMYAVYQNMLATAKKITGEALTGYTGAYDGKSFMIPEYRLDSSELDRVEAHYDALRQAEDEAQSGNDMDDVF